MTQNSALVIGATGGIGGEVAAALLARDWRVRALTRRPNAETSKRLRGIEWVQGDAMKAAEVARAAEGSQIIVHGANPPGYRNWESLALPMLESTIAAARAQHARILFPGTVYNFGPDAFPLLSETSPQNPKTRKGAIRVRMESALEGTAKQGAKVLILRAGDFFGPHPGNNWFSQGMVTPGKPVRGITYPGGRRVGHAWAYLPDVAETFMRLLERADHLAGFEVFHFGGYWLEPGVGIAEAIRRAAGNPKIPIRSLPWWAIGLSRPFVPISRELWEMRYLWQEPVRLDNAKLVRFLGQEPQTPLDDAVRATLAGLGCLPPAH